jgi:hypothetical protein
MKEYTVVGLYHDNKQVWVGFIGAKSVASAVKKAHADMEQSGGGGAVLSVFDGKHHDWYDEDELYEE